MSSITAISVVVGWLALDSCVRCPRCGGRADRVRSLGLCSLFRKRACLGATDQSCHVLIDSRIDVVCCYHLFCRAKAAASAHSPPCVRAMSVDMARTMLTIVRTQCGEWRAMPFAPNGQRRFACNGRLDHVTSGPPSRSSIHRGPTTQAIPRH